MRGLKYDPIRWSVVAGALFLSATNCGPGDADAGTAPIPLASAMVPARGPLRRQPTADAAGIACVLLARNIGNSASLGRMNLLGWRQDGRSGYRAVRRARRQESPAAATKGWLAVKQPKSQAEPQAGGQQ